MAKGKMKQIIDVNETERTIIEVERQTKKSIINMIKDVFSINHDTASHVEIHDRIVSGSVVRGTNMCVLMLAILIASIGLNMNSTAVIIGAMLISPLMGTIQAMGYATATVDLQLLERSAIGFVCQVAISLVTSVIYFKLSPISDMTSELLARTQPTIWDVMIAICGGLAGIIGITRKEKSNVIPGVAIATALMPPLCTCGYSIANGQWKMFFGAGYLFLVNSYFIFLTAAILLLILDVPKVKELDPKFYQKIKKGILRNTIIITIPSIIFGWLMAHNAKTQTDSSDLISPQISLEMVDEELSILFPDVESVQVGVMETLDQQKNVVEKKTFVIQVDHMDQKEQIKMKKWLEKRYPSYDIMVRE